MTMSRFDDDVLTHPKLLVAGEDAANLWLRSILYANKHDTDGVILAAVVRAFTEKPPKVVAALAAKLVEAKLWDVRPEGGWKIHNFGKRNWSAEQREAHRAEVSARRSAAGKAGNAKRWDGRKAIATGDADASQEASQNDRKTIANGIANAGVVCETHESQAHRPAPAPAIPDDEEGVARVRTREGPEPDDAQPRRDPFEPLVILSCASGGVIDPVSANLGQQKALLDRLRALDVTDDELRRMGELVARDPAAVWPWAKGIGRTVRPRFLLGPGDPSTGHEGNALADLVAAVRRPADTPIGGTATPSRPGAVVATEPLAVDRPAMSGPELKATMARGLADLRAAGIGRG